MASISQILLITLLISLNVDYSSSLSCYQCEICPIPFNSSSFLVRKEDNCNWCAKLLLGDGQITVRKCSAECSYDFWKIPYIKFSYYCCQTDYCNKSVQTCRSPQMLLVIFITMICYFINNKK
ncbi:hypothetical protein EWB00_003244 [Schistosoma japonicum]|uniref:Uncharacterized protein n=1 Tax=Schistosoma japonicum TaxID=6182 RepID=A0A4Z2D9B6_SCHJA|nr:hypothetical protein KSF78_0000330 [Schistosoma japonicum]TNN13046.1 hypothetical protein EWB00_003244 [Schistosoma japonicum]